MQALAGYTGWKFEYVKCDWSNCFDKIENGHIAKPIQVDKLLSTLAEVWGKEMTDETDCHMLSLIHI